ncbi:hypothetical protein HPB50_021323 [Hyalomma asiaticum]|uniref:Uncharacterized protein n=1 Tax=Hyalomma asiaticum TaxID=266040 RepID=A0ACB7SCY9_HYAAI|nr:hypothetical protein HPB50_021323 [Hyalomma asiaticum]
MWNTLSPRGYRIISQSGLLSLPSCSTLKRHIGAIGDGTASLGEPPSPTGETLPSMEDIDDIHQLQDANVHLIDPSTDEISSDASEEHVHTDTDNTARADNENTAQDGCVRSASPDLRAERSQSLTEDAPSIAFPENGSKPNFNKGPQSKKKFLACQFAKPLAEDPTAEEGEQVLQVVYKKPSDILDENHGADGKMRSTGDTTTATESAIDSNCGSCNNAKQADRSEPTAEFTAPSNWLSSAADKPADSVQIVTTEMKKKDAKRLATVRNKRLQSMVRSNVLCSKPSRPKPVSSKVRKDRSAAGRSRCLHRTSNFSSTASVTAAEKTEDYLSGHNLQLASPCKDLAELLNIVGAGTSNSTESAICAPSPVQGAAVSSGTERQLSLAETSSLDDAVELSVVPTVTSSSLDSDGVFPSDGVQVLKVICTEPSEGSLCEDFPEAVPKTTVVPSGEENQVFQIFYVCTPENLGASQ